MSIAHWCRIELAGKNRLGRLHDNEIALYEGDLFDNPVATGEKVDASTANWLPPVTPRQFLGLWNNFHERQQLENTILPDFPLFFVKLGDALAAHKQPVRRPPGFDGKVKFEAELGIVMGRPCFQPELADVDGFIFGYTCVNDVTAPEPLFANPEFHQWCRAKSLPGFGPIGPVVATGIDPAPLRVRGILDDEVKQDYPVSDMIFSPQEVVHRIASEIRLFPGDVIACGTSVGAVELQDGQTIVVEIPGIGSLSNRFM